MLKTVIADKYWIERLSGTLPFPDLYKSGHTGDKVERIEIALASETLAKINKLTGGAEISQYIYFLTALGILLNKYSGLNDVLVVTGSFNYNKEKSTVPETLFLRTVFSTDLKVKELLNIFRQTVVEACKYQKYSYDKLISSIALADDQSDSSLFQVGLSDSRINFVREGIAEKTDLWISIIPEVSGLLLSFNYKNVFEQTYIQQLANHFLILCDTLVDHIESLVSKLSLLLPEQKQELISYFTGPINEQEKNSSLVTAFADGVKMYPDSPAVFYRDDKLTYMQLDQYSSSFAAYLLNNCKIKQGSIAAVSLSSSFELMVTIMALLKAGVAIMPLDQSLPTLRINALLEDSCASVLISESIDPDIIVPVCIDRKTVTSIMLLTNTIEPLIIQPSDLAYIIYTSGSTGNSKAVKITHRNILTQFHWFKSYFGFLSQDVLPQKTTIGFVDSILELLFPITTGNSAVFLRPDDEIIQDVPRLMKWLGEIQTTIIQLVPSIFDYIQSQANISTLKRLKILILSGEELKRTYDFPFEVYNIYGSSECTAYSLIYKLNGKENGKIPIGKPIDNTTVCILNENEIQPLFITGEIYIGGKSVSSGYLNRVELTAEKFVKDVTVSGMTMYRTGDFGRYLPTGDIEYLGRKDGQLKIRGQRIEPGDIENKIRLHPAVEEAVVWYICNGEKKPVLSAFFTLKKKTAQTNNQLDITESHTNMDDVVKQLDILCRKHLPFYMVPSQFKLLESFPRLSNGKINRKLMETADSGIYTSQKQLINPRNAIEEKLLKIFKNILGKNDIGIDNSFFKNGGHSLNATQLSTRIIKEFNVKIALHDIFDNPTVEKLARIISASRTEQHQPIPPIQVQSSYPLSSSQQRLWILSQFEAVGGAYNMCGVYDFEGNELNISILERAFQRLIFRHEILRTAFKKDEHGMVRQHLTEGAVFQVEYHDVFNISEKEFEAHLLSSSEQEFNLSSGPLLRAVLYRRSEVKWTFLCVMHHIISDGWSMSIIIKELLSYYNSEVTGQVVSTKELRIQYKDYSVWQQDRLKSKDLEKNKNYWLQQLGSNLPVLDLPGDRPRPLFKTYHGGIIKRSLPTELISGLTSLSNQQGGTLFMCLLAGVNVLLYRYTGQEDVIIGSPIACRNHPDLEDQIGFYVNTLALRSVFKGTESYVELLKHTKRLTMEAYEHQSYPFDELVDALAPERDMSRSALFDVMVAFQDQPVQQLQLGKLKVEKHKGFESRFSKFDLVFNFSLSDFGVELELEYNSDIYNGSTAKRLACHLEQLLHAVIKEPSQALNRLDYLTREEKQQLLTGFNNAEVSFPSDKTIVNLFEEQVKRTPENVALIFGKTQLTYKELNEKANQLGSYLRKRYKVKADDLLGIKLERSEWMVISILGILKSGGAYVPIDPMYPEDRINYMINDSKCSVVIDEEELQAFKQQEDKYSKSNPDQIILPSSLAYVIYTSGTTGQPKGVMIEHRNVVRLHKTDEPLFDFNQKDVWTMFHSYCFDVSVWEMYGALLFGGKLVVISSMTAKDPEAYVHVLNNEGVTILNQTPSSFYNLISHALDDQAGDLHLLRYVIFAGEALSPAMLRQWHEKNPGAKLINMYGITETTVHVTYKEITQTEIETNISNIGKPIPTLNCYVLDEAKNLLPVGVQGELYVGGEGVARGYLNKPELTAERFIQNPIIEDKRLYASGDKVKILESGDMEYLGRKDDQVKIRGYRIELGEIESALNSQAHIDASVVLAKADAKGGKELFAYIVSKEEFDVRALRTMLASYIPAYMIPAHFIKVEKLPLTSNGKVDKKSLQRMEGKAVSSATAYIAAGNETEEQLVKIWEEILEKKNIGIADNFFELGGHSLKAISVIYKIEKKFGVKIKVQDFFIEPTISSLSNAIKAYRWVNTAIREENREIFEL